jgi:hypothetical protein
MVDVEESQQLEVQLNSKKRSEMLRGECPIFRMLMLPWATMLA